MDVVVGCFIAIIKRHIYTEVKHKITGTRNEGKRYHTSTWRDADDGHHHHHLQTSLLPPLRSQTLFLPASARRWLALSLHCCCCCCCGTKNERRGTTPPPPPLLPTGTTRSFASLVGCMQSHAGQKLYVTHTHQSHAMTREGVVGHFS